MTAADSGLLSIDAAESVPFVHLEAALVVVDKPAGLLSVPGRGPVKADCASQRVQARVADALVVHRLDMATSGLLLFARGPAMQRRLGDAFAARQVSKTYVARVHGWPAADAGVIDLPLSADWPNRPRQQVDRERGRPSLTRWQVMARDGSGARLLLQPVTGRSHQLRVHLAAIGHPIVGDILYGGPPAPRLLLHAARLELPEVDGVTRRVFDSPVPF